MNENAQDGLGRDAWLSAYFMATGYKLVTGDSERESLKREKRE